MGAMTAQLPLPAPMDAGAIPIGAAASPVEDEAGGRVFVHGELAYAWDAGDAVSRRFAAAKLADIKAGSVAEVAAGFGVDPGTLWRSRQVLSAGGVLGLAAEKSGPKGPSRLTDSVMSQIRSLRGTGLSLRAIGTRVGVSEFGVRRTLAMEAPAPEEPAAAERAGRPEAEPVQEELPVLPGPVDRSGERAAARAGLVECASPVFAPAARVPLAGLFLALPALENTGLLECSKETFGALPNGFYGLETILTGAVFQALAGEPRAEGITRIDPVALGRVLGLDGAPEVKTLAGKPPPSPPRERPGTC